MTQTAENLMTSKCPVCSTQINEEPKVCQRCFTPHHQDCWDYCGECAVFACNLPETKRNKFRLSKESSVLISSIRKWIMYQEFTAILLLSVGLINALIPLFLLAAIPIPFIGILGAIPAIFLSIPAVLFVTALFLLPVTFLLYSIYKAEVAHLLDGYTPSFKGEYQSIADKLKMTEGDAQIVRYTEDLHLIVRLLRLLGILMFFVPLAFQFSSCYADKFIFIVEALIVSGAFTCMGTVVFHYGRKRLIDFTCMQNRFLASVKK